MGGSTSPTTMNPDASVGGLGLNSSGGTVLPRDDSGITAHGGGPDTFHDRLGSNSKGGEESKAPSTDTDSDGPVSISEEITVALSQHGEDISQAQFIDATSPIEHIYLTFSTPLPTPNVPSDLVEPPQCPNLQPYIDPHLWPETRKRTLLILSCIATFLTAYTAGAYSPPAYLIAENLHTTHLATLTGITTFCIGFAFAPMVLAPFSEINGRYPVFVIAGFIYLIFQAVCGLVKTLGGMLIGRFFTGVGGSVFSTMVGGVISDLWHKEERNTPMSLFSGSVLMGTGAGPLIAAVMTRQWGDNAEWWKWIFWHQVVLDGGLMVSLIILFSESRGSVLLSRKAKKLNKWYEELESRGSYGVWLPNSDSEKSHPDRQQQISIDEEKAVSRADTSGQLKRIRWLVKEDEQRSTISKMITISVYRPFHLLFTEPVVFFFSLWVSFAWAVLYLTFGSIPLVFERQYGFDIQQSGYVFIAMIVGAVIATMIGIGQEQILKHPKWQAGFQPGAESSNSFDQFWSLLRRRFPVDAPESRLYCTCVTACFLPLGLFMFGFTSHPEIHWIVPTIAICFATMGILSIYLATFNYLADAYHAYASSALAAQSFCRNVLGGVFPLVVGVLFRNLGESAAGGLLGGIATILTAVPWVLVFYGERIRSRSAFAVALEKTES